MNSREIALVFAAFGMTLICLSLYVALSGAT